MQIGRRGALALGGSAVAAYALTACSDGPPQPAASTRAPTSPASTDIDQLITERPFLVAHRGGSKSAPEMTMAAYEKAVAAGFRALEVSVHRSSDGVFVGCHDATTGRVADVDLTVAETPWATLADVQVRGDDGSTAPMTRLETVLDAYASTHVIFLEDKTYKNDADLLAMVRRYRNPTRQFVWKVFGNAGESSIRAGVQAGLKTWGYWFPGDMGAAPASSSEPGSRGSPASEGDVGTAQFREHARRVDWVGVSYDSSSVQFEAAREMGQLTIGHIVARAEQRDTLLKEGCHGLMVANLDLAAT